jgi:hypothetical protein
VWRMCGWSFPPKLRFTTRLSSISSDSSSRVQRNEGNGTNAFNKLSRANLIVPVPKIPALFCVSLVASKLQSHVKHNAGRSTYAYSTASCSIFSTPGFIFCTPNRPQQPFDSLLLRRIRIRFLASPHHCRHRRTVPFTSAKAGAPCSGGSSVHLPVSDPRLPRHFGVVAAREAARP